ncbi:MAG: sigma-70 family RNA polymerase sigma factor [Deltaproteobacteria bacterium]
MQARTPFQLSRGATADAGAEERPRPSAAVVARLFDQHAPYVGRTLRCLGVRDHELSDVLQEVFLLAHDRLPPFEHDAAARERAWLYAICVRKALSARRDAARRAVREVRDDARVAEAPGAQSPHDELERTRKLAQAMAILEQLDEDKRVVFVLYEVEQLAMSEVAARTETSAIDLPVSATDDAEPRARDSDAMSLAVMRDAVPFVATDALFAVSDEPREALRAPREALRAPREALRAPREALRAPREALSVASHVEAASTTKSADTSSVVEAEPSALHASAMRRVAADQCDEAAPLLSRVVEGETSDAAERVEQAELALARCLFTLGYVITAASVADAIATRSDHRARLATLELLARLGERLPDPRAVVGTVGHYRANELLDAEPRHLGTLRYLLGRARYEEGGLEEAAVLFASVPPGHRFHVPARYLEGMSHVRARHARQAIAAFEAVRAASQGTAGGGSGERDRYRDLARLALARVRYTAARPGQGERASRRVALLEDALETWQEIPFGGEAGLEAFFEESWALYVLDDSPRALGHIHGLLAPQLRERPHPEAQVLRATIYFEHCRFEAARHTVDDFHARFDPLLAELEQLEGSLAETDMAYAWLESVRSGRSPLRGEAGEVVRAALDDRELARLVVSVRAIEAEGERLAHAPSEIREGSLGMRIAQELALARSFTVELGGRLVRERLARVTGALRDRANEIDTIALELDTVTRRALESGAQLTSEPERPAPIVAVQGDQVWPFDGEYWEDELPYYRELVTDLCVR